MAFGPEVGLQLLDAIADTDALRNYAPLPAALTRNRAERAFLLARAEACG